MSAKNVSLKDRIIHKFYCSKLGTLYCAFLLWLDRKKGNENQFMPHELAPAIMQEAHKLAIAQGVQNIKKKVNTLIKAKTAEEYDRVLKELEDMLPEAGEGSYKEQLIEALKKVHVRKGRDVSTALGKAKMIDKRIQDYYELQRYRERRKLASQIRKEKDPKKKKQLKKQWVQKYGK